MNKMMFSESPNHRTARDRKVGRYYSLMARSQSGSPERKQNGAVHAPRLSLHGTMSRQSSQCKPSDSGQAQFFCDGCATAWHLSPTSSYVLPATYRVPEPECARSVGVWVRISSSARNNRECVQPANGYGEGRAVSVLEASSTVDAGNESRCGRRLTARGAAGACCGQVPRVSAQGRHAQGPGVHVTLMFVR